MGNNQFVSNEFDSIDDEDTLNTVKRGRERPSNRESSPMTSTLVGNNNNNNNDNRKIILSSIRNDTTQEETPRTLVSVLMLGSGSSGKTTILRQCSLLYSSEIMTTADKLFSKTVIRQYCLSSLQELLSMCNDQVEPENEDAARVVKRLTVKAAEHLQIVDPVLKESMFRLWKDKMIQDTWLKRRHETTISDNLEYNFENFNRIMDDAYVPTDLDILNNSMKTVGVFNRRFRIRDDLDICLWDTGGQISERKKWKAIYLHEPLDFVLFVVNIADYNRPMYEDCTINRLQDSLELFTEILKIEALQDIPIILIFNKIDLFTEKIVQLGDLSKHFPVYNGPPNDPDAGRSFIREMFMDRVMETRDKRHAELFTYEINAIEIMSVKHLLVVRNH